MLDITTWSKFNYYTFYEKTHQYYYYDKPVKKSVTQFLEQFWEPFDREGISKKYAEKHHMSQQDVLEEWTKKGQISAHAGTIVHKYLEDYARGKVFELDFSAAQADGVRAEVEERVAKLLPQATAFHQDTLNRLIPIQLEYTVGIEDYLAGNIDMLCWNVKQGEFQIWDYKNVKEMSTFSPFKKKCLAEFSRYDDCNYVHYSMQLNFYKEMLQRVLGIEIGKCYLVHFSHESDNFKIYECLNLATECSLALNRYIREEKGKRNEY